MCTWHTSIFGIMGSVGGLMSVDVAHGQSSLCMLGGAGQSRTRSSDLQRRMWGKSVPSRYIHSSNCKLYHTMLSARKPHVNLYDSIWFLFLTYHTWAVCKGDCEYIIPGIRCVCIRCWRHLVRAMMRDVHCAERAGQCNYVYAIIGQVLKFQKTYVITIDHIYSSILAASRSDGSWRESSGN
ncbi:hypothetical protein BDZ97DRAFT_677321 [Flammula alnicola]|nr:hypothetical protein BDZ97DRAFT_677321 [Flammula alnicola]